MRCARCSSGSKPRLPPPAPPVREKRAMRDDIDEQLLPVFLEEAQQLVPDLGADLRDWKADPSDARSRSRCGALAYAEG